MRAIKSTIQLVLFIGTIISTSILIWAGFSGKQEIFPWLLSLTLTLAFVNLMLNQYNHKNGRIYWFIAGIALLSLGWSTFLLFS
ncbi:hypothetical protein [Sutcliffiella rhizosphaerae]|uniref:hypothetical protein n=1 Tax=Sutcliffiella rhizosphaerae TaxID=2880967 RepID=UPI001E2A6F4F|nr:hypothetical protein [Sutcliffiella rhizosphaerae]